MADNPQVPQAPVIPVAEVVVPAAPQAALPAEVPAADAGNLVVKCFICFSLFRFHPLSGFSPRAQPPFCLCPLCSRFLYSLSSLRCLRYAALSVALVPLLLLPFWVVARGYFSPYFLSAFPSAARHVTALAYV